MPTLTQKDLKLQSPIPITDIEEFYMEIRKNNHAVFHMEGAISEEEGKDAVLQPLSETTVMVSANNRTLFMGILKEVQITHEGAGYHVSLTGVSSTEKLDYRKKNRSFQDVSQTYRAVMEQVIAGTLGAKLRFHGLDQKIGRAHV